MSGSRLRLAALDSSFARSHSCSSLLRALFAYTVDGDRRAPDLLRKSTESQPVSMARCTRFVRIGTECAGSRSELGEALAAADSSHWVTPPCSLIIGREGGSASTPRGGTCPFRQVPEPFHILYFGV